MNHLLQSQLQSYASAGLYPLHMPGHKRRVVPAPGLPAGWDMTEVPGVDDLHDADGILADAMARTAALWGAKRTWYLVNGSTALFYQKDLIQDYYKGMANYILEFTEKYNMTFPGWEPERMAKLDELFKAYAPVTKEKLWDNLKYFLEAIMPTCRECDIKMAIHQDDPPWDIFGLPRLLVDAESIDRFLTMVDDPYNCLTLCSGSMNANPNNNVAAIVRKHCDRIPFAHVRNIHHFENGDFSEAAHRDCCGETGIIEILRAYHDCGFDGCIRPDHGRQLWEEGPGKCRPGYGKYDRALGVQYMLGVWDLLDRLDEEKNR